MNIMNSTILLYHTSQLLRNACINNQEIFLLHYKDNNLYYYMQLNIFDSTIWLYRTSELLLRV